LPLGRRQPCTSKPSTQQGSRALLSALPRGSSTFSCRGRRTSQPADHVVEFDLTSSGRIKLEGSGGSGELEIEIPTGTYRARLSGFAFEAALFEYPRRCVSAGNTKAPICRDFKPSSGLASRTREKSRSRHHGQHKRANLQGFYASPLTDSNRRPPPYHEREEGADPCGFAHSGAGSHVSLVAARHRVFHGRATLVRPGLTARLVRLVHRLARLLPRQLSTSIPFHLAAKARVGRPVSVSGGIPIGECEDLTAREMKSSQEESALRCHHRRRLPA
jgi:hypothetical protein